MPKKLEINLDKPSLYCGNANKLPDDYNDFGTPYECLKKGFGAGKSSCDDSNEKILTQEEVKRIATKLNIPLKTGRGKKRPETLIRNIISVLKDIETAI